MKPNIIAKLALSSMLFLSAFGIALQANAQSAIGEVFICNYENDADYSDLMKVRDFYVQQAEKVGLTTPASFTWQPLKTSSDADFLWFSYYQNNAGYGQFADAMAGSADMQKAVERFEAMSDCNSALMSQQQIFDGGEPLESPPGYIHSFACNFRDGAGQSSLADLNSHIRGYLGSSDLHKSFLVFQSNPLTSAPDSPDLRMFTVSANAADWGARQDALQSSEEGQQLVRHVNAILDCSSSHWLGENVVAPPVE